MSRKTVARGIHAKCSLVLQNGASSVWSMRTDQFAVCLPAFESLRSLATSRCNSTANCTRARQEIGWTSPVTSRNSAISQCRCCGTPAPWASLVLFQGSLGPGSTQQPSLQAGSFSKWVSSSAETRPVRLLSLGSNSVSNLTVTALDRRAEVDTDGLVPTSLFHSVFISHQGKFAILNPSFPREFAKP